MPRHYSLLDRFLIDVDNILKIAGTQKANTQRPYPAETITEPSLTDNRRKEIARLMRVNHTGEIAAQGLYLGQALTASNETIKQQMRDAALEEHDHLLWCQQRLEELHDRPSYLQPLWYIGSFGIGVAAGLCGDKFSLGFLEETERQVTQHLDGHLDRLANDDPKTKAIVDKMQQDEIRHADTAKAAGAKELPLWIKKTMKATAKIMTGTSAWI